MIPILKIRAIQSILNGRYPRRFQLFTSKFLKINILEPGVYVYIGVGTSEASYSFTCFECKEFDDEVLCGGGDECSVVGEWEFSFAYFFEEADFIFGAAVEWCDSY